MKKLSLKIKCLFCLLVLVICFVTGCSDEKVIDESVVGETSVVSVDFADETSSSRFLVDSLEAIYKPEDLFWMYTAEKVGEVYSLGETRDSSGALVKTPVSAGNLRGLAGYPKKFSIGTWTFNVYGYLDQAHTKLVYSGKREKVLIEANTDGTAKTPVVGFELTNEGSYHDKGTIDFGPIVVTVPEDKTLASGATLSMTVQYVDGSSKKQCATANKTLDEAYNPGDLIVFDSFTWSTTVTNSFDPGDLELIFHANYDTSDILGDYSYKTKVVGGMITVVEGNVGDLGGMVASTGSIKSGNFVPYKTLKEAILADKATVSVWQDINDAGIVSLPAGRRNIDVKTKNHYVNNISFSDPSDNSRYIAFIPEESNGSEGWMTFKGGTLSINDTGTDVYISTSGDSCEIGITLGANRSNVVRHVGTLKNLTLSDGPNNVDKNWGYCFDGECTGELVVRKGWLKLGPNANVKKLNLLNVSKDKVNLTGNTTTVVGNMDEIRDLDIIINSPLNTDAIKSALIKSCKLSPNGGEIRYIADASSSTPSRVVQKTSIYKYLYGIEGMYMDMPLMVDSERDEASKHPEIYVYDDKAFMYWYDTDASTVRFKDGQKHAYIVERVVSPQYEVTAKWLDWGLCITAEEDNCEVYTQFTTQAPDTHKYGGKYALQPRAKLKYSTDFGTNWKDYNASTPSSDGTSFTHGDTITLKNRGDKVIFKAKEYWVQGGYRINASRYPSFAVYDDTSRPSESIYCSKLHTASGAIRAFVFPSASDRLTSSTPTFDIDCTKGTVDSPVFVAGANAYYCGGVFFDDSGLTVAPRSLYMRSGDFNVGNNFFNTFKNCTSLKYVFFDCSGYDCSSTTYYGMQTFSGCTNVHYIELSIVGTAPNGGFHSKSFDVFAGMGTDAVAAGMTMICACNGYTYDSSRNYIGNYTRIEF